MQKQLLTSVLFLLMMNAAWGQRYAIRNDRPSEGLLYSFVQNSNASRAEDCDTLRNIAPTDTITLFTTDSGYVAGQNEFGDLGKADYFANPNNKAKLHGVFMWFGFASFANSNAKFTVTVWDVNNNDQPGTVLGTKDVTISSVTAATNANQPVYIEFTTPVTLSGAFFAGITFTYSNGDTIALMTNVDRGDGGVNTAWELWNDNSWHEYSDSWEIWTSHYIFPVVCDAPAGIGSMDMGLDVNLYPNPAENAVTVELPSDVAAQEIVVSNILGAKVLNHSVNSGEKFQTIDIHQLEQGIYFVQVTDGFKVIGTSKLVVR